MEKVTRPRPIYLVLERDWCPFDYENGVVIDRKRLMGAYISRYAARGAALAKFDKFANACGRKPVYYQDLKTVAEKWSRLSSMDDQYKTMVAHMRSLKSDFQEHPYGTMYEVEELCLPSGAWELEPPFPLFVVGKTRLKIGERFDPRHSDFSIISAHIDEQCARIEAICLYADYVQRTEDQDMNGAIDGWDSLDWLQRYDEMVEREETRIDDESLEQFGFIFPVYQTEVINPNRRSSQFAHGIL